MVGTMKKAMIYLGLADGEEIYDEELEEKAQKISSGSTGSSSVGESAGRVTSAQRRIKGSDQDSSHVSHTPSDAPEMAEKSFRSGRGAGQVIDIGSADYRAPVTPIKRASQGREESSEVHQLTTIHPRSYNDAKLIGESFRSGIPVIMNVTDMSESEAKRLVDFSAGLVFGLHGTIERVTNKVFLLTPSNVEVITEGATGSEDETSFFNQA